MTASAFTGLCSLIYRHNIVKRHSHPISPAQGAFRCSTILKPLYNSADFVFSLTGFVQLTRVIVHLPLPLKNKTFIKNIFFKEEERALVGNGVLRATSRKRKKKKVKKPRSPEALVTLTRREN